MFNNIMYSTDGSTSGIFRGLAIHKKSEPTRVYIPGINVSPLNENGEINEEFYQENKQHYGLAQWCANSMRDAIPQDIVLPAWVMYETGNTQRPVILGYYGKGLTMADAWSGGVGSGGAGTIISKKVLIVPGHSISDDNSNKPKEGDTVETNFGTLKWVSDIRDKDGKNGECTFNRKTAQAMYDYIERTSPGLAELYPNINDYNRSLIKDIFNKTVKKGFFTNYQAIVEIHYNYGENAMFMLDPKLTDQTVKDRGKEFMDKLKEEGYPVTSYAYKTDTKKSDGNFQYTNGFLVDLRCSIEDGQQHYYYLETKDMGKDVTDEDCKKIGEALGEIVCKHYKVIRSGNLQAVAQWAHSLIGTGLTYKLGAGHGGLSDNPTSLDCSSFTSWCYYKAGLGDKNNTWTTNSYYTDAKNNNDYALIMEGNKGECQTYINNNQLSVGDLVISSTNSHFSADGNSHVVMFAPGTYNGQSFKFVHCSTASGVGGNEGDVVGTDNIFYSSTRSFYAIVRYNKPLPSTGPSIQGAVGVIEKMDKYKSEATIPSGAKITYDDLRYLSIPHYTFSGSTTTGHMIVHKDLAQDVINIFAELYAIRYPINKMKPIKHYEQIASQKGWTTDFASIEDDNTSAFNYRNTSGEGTSGGLSQHAFGRAIDINPIENPFVGSSGSSSHSVSNNKGYCSRDTSKWKDSVAKSAFIGPGTKIYEIFTNHGWSWGGTCFGASVKDYQHFEKKA